MSRGILLVRAEIKAGNQRQQVKNGSFYVACHAPRLVDTNAGSLAPESEEVCATECTYQTAV